MKIFKTLLIGACLLLPFPSFADIADFPTVWPGCPEGQEKISCTSSYGEGCEEYLNNPEYFISNRDQRGVETDYEFCKEAFAPQKEKEDVLPPEEKEDLTGILASLAALAGLSAGLFFWVKRRPQS